MRFFNLTSLLVAIFFIFISMSVATTERISPAGENTPVGDSLYLSIALDTFVIKANFKPLPKEFFKKAGKSIVSKYSVFTNTMRKTGILASVQAAQYIIEGDSGNSSLARDYHNHFGVKFFGKTDVPGFAGKVWKKDSGEGKYAWWYIYKDDQSSFEHHAQILQGRRYRHLIGIKTYPEYLKGAKKGGYASADDYVYILANVIYSRKLYELDYLVFKNYKDEWEHAVSQNKQRMESQP